MPIALIAETAANGSDPNGVTTGTIDTTGADLLVIVVSDYKATTSATPTDSKGNTWTALTSYVSSNFNRAKIWYSKPTSVGSGHTASYSLTSGFSSVAFLAFSGSAATPFDQENGANNGGGTTSLSTGSVTPSEDNELVLAGLSQTNGLGASIDSGFTLANQTAYTAGVCFGVGSAYKIQTSATAVNPAWTWPVASEAATGIATFKSGSSPPPPPPATTFDMVQNQQPDRRPFKPVAY